MAPSLLIDLFSEKRFLISNLCTVFGTPGSWTYLVTKALQNMSHIHLTILMNNSSLKFEILPLYTRLWHCEIRQCLSGTLGGTTHHFDVGHVWRVAEISRKETCHRPNSGVITRGSCYRELKKISLKTEVPRTVLIILQ